MDLTIELKISQFPDNLSNDFKTHFNYLDYLFKISENISVTSSHKLTLKPDLNNDDLTKKIKLIECFKKSLDEEFNSIINCNEFAIFNNAWIATKSYYLLFHMWSVIYSLISGNYSHLKASHISVLNFMKSNIESKKIVFNNNEFNELWNYLDLKTFTCPPGSNLKENYSKTEIHILILKKIGKYKFEDFKRNKKINDFRSKNNQEKRDKFYKSEKISLFEYFYMYRIKTDYRDVNFLDNCENSHLHFSYYKNYYKLTINIYEALKIMINDLSHKIDNKIIIK